MLMKSLKRFAAFLLALLTVSGVAAPAFASSSVVDAKSAIAVDAQTGQVLYQQNANQKRVIASITKLLTMMVIEDEIKDHKLSWNSKVKISKAVAKVSDSSEYSSVGLQAGDSYTVKELVRVALVKSADGATLALAGATGDSTASFNRKMQKKAKQIGVTDATIVNSVGLENGDLPSSLKLKGVSSSAENKMTAKDVAKLASYFVKHYPTLTKIAKLTSTKITISNQSQTIQTINELLTDTSYAVSGVTYTGLKTGTSDAAGYSLVSTATYKGRQLVTVVLHANGSDSTARFTATQKLYQWIVNQGYQPQTLKLAKAAQTVKVKGGLPLTIKVSTPNLVVWTKNKLTKSYKATVHLASSKAKNGKVVAPVSKGETIGKVTIKVPGLTFLTGGNKASTSLVAKQSASKANIFKILWAKLTN